MKVGDKITAIDCVGRLGHCLVVKIGPDRIPSTEFIFRTFGGNNETITALSDEGITWISGWHDPASDIVTAMLAAYTLGAEHRVLALHDADKAYIAGEIDFETWKRNLDRWDVWVVVADHCVLQFDNEQGVTRL